ncbi:SWIM zinc finger family protein [Roseateles depolymerans]|uniref:SWIM zinc finger-containing protein n=1 Tax=Roseateles depolymerans TaxID=76731 RepID=A0A0U3N7I2_9BURK|nr:SWIM zinc finger family protein [Roseateles depolymerans]ALV04528.1 SWIM zinc finger-containing protein [Roseateles depolymerans]REG14060.1 SWIM zinc finger protein [Roseateles depolymerans]
MSSVSHSYRYPHPSFVATQDKPRLVLATSATAETPAPNFFEGQLRSPRIVADMLTAVHLTVGARFFVPPNSVARAAALADPVVTAGGGVLRFEGFSSCCSTYIRADLLPEAYDGQVVGKGTTNIDFNAPMRAALAGIRDASGLALSVGPDALTLRSGIAEVTERKVELPTRWIRGMVEVQSYQAAMQKRFEVSALEALRFLRTLPKASTSRTPLWIASGPRGLYTTTRPVDGGVRVTDTRRLRVLQALLPQALTLAVHADDTQQTSAWVVDFGTARLTLALSAEVWRGFSGEGQALRALLDAGTRGAPLLARVRSALQWQARLDPQLLADELALCPSQVADALRVLGASGLAGFDVTEGLYFHRVLPLDLSAVADMHPRLVDAQALMDEGAVTVLKREPFEATVRSGDLLHRVRDKDGELHCTCPWFAAHHGLRGPCKHVLAAEGSRIP